MCITMHFKPKMNWCVVFIAYKFANTAGFTEEKKICTNLPLTASELLIEVKMTAAAESDSTFARWT